MKITSPQFMCSLHSESWKLPSLLCMPCVVTPMQNDPFCVTDHRDSG